MSRSGIAARLLPAAALACLAGCAGYAPTPAWKIDPVAIAALEPGVTTAAEVRERIGIPVTESVFPRLGDVVWDYRYFSGATWMRAQLHFDANGRYRYAVIQLDHDYYSGGLGM
jgi:outer membrane protein assembly factor BamE (lipoprotein component of BamABCDE complex)